MVSMVKLLGCRACLKSQCRLQEERGQQHRWPVRMLPASLLPMKVNKDGAEEDAP